jgi:hydrogenase 3 maturation protease
VAESRRVAFLGIGHPLRRDDAAGVEVCDRLRPALRRRADVLVVSGGSAPENCVGALRAFGPDLVVIIDAARMGQPPGSVLRIDPSDPRAAGASTHTLPLPVFCHYLADTLGCDVTLLGIEPADTSFGEGLTPAVEQAVAEAVRQATVELLRGSGASWISPTASDSQPHPLPPLRQEDSNRSGAVAERGRIDSKDGGSKAPPILRETLPSPGGIRSLARHPCAG